MITAEVSGDHSRGIGGDHSRGVPMWLRRPPLVQNDQKRQSIKVEFCTNGWMADLLHHKLITSIFK